MLQQHCRFALLSLQAPQVSRRVSLPESGAPLHMVLGDGSGRRGAALALLSQGLNKVTPRYCSVEVLCVLDCDTQKPQRHVSFSLSRSSASL